MTLVGKIFTVLILVMSIMFMSFSVMVYATHKNWEEYATNTVTTGGKPLGLESQLAQAQQATKDANDLIQSLRTDLKNEQAARAAVLGAMSARLVRSESDLAAEQAELAALFTSHSQATAAAEEAQKRLTTLEEEIAATRGDLRTTEQDLDTKMAAVIRLTDDLNQAISLRDQEKERNTQAVLQIAQMKSVMDANNLTVDSLVSHIPPKVEAVVLEVGAKDLIEISIGSDDGLKVGHAMEVYRDNTYLGRIVIRRTAPDRAVGQILKELQRGQIKRGDRVSTKLS
ncbi:MAG: hypothetical protein WD872_21310 [Pirellulaceae bacterium]